MMGKSIVGILVLLFTLTAQAADSWLKWSLVAMASDKRVSRGALFYPYPTGIFGLGITLFNHVHIRGPSIAFSYGNRKDPLSIEVGSRFVGDGASMFSFTDGFHEHDGYWSSRPDGFEIYGRVNYNFGFNNLFGLRIYYGKEVNEHKGNYLALGFKVPVYKYTSLTYTVGVGSEDHNRYYYGDGAVSGVGHSQFSLKYVIPHLPWTGIIMFVANYDQVKKDENRQASLARHDKDNLSFSTRWIWRF